MGTTVTMEIDFGMSITMDGLNLIWAQSSERALDFADAWGLLSG